MKWLRDDIHAAGNASAPMTSMIDVVFLLLIFFMVTANFAEREGDLPSALATEGSGGEAALEPQVVDVFGAPGGRAVFRIGANSVGGRAELAAILELLPKGPGLIVRVRDDAPIWASAAALQAATDAGFEKRTYVPG